MALFVLKLDISKEYKEYVEDLLKLTFSIFIAYLVYISSTSSPLSKLTFFNLYTFLLIGLSSYHLIFKQLLEIK